MRQMNITGGQTAYAVNGAQRGVDASAQAWQSRLWRSWTPPGSSASSAGRETSCAGDRVDPRGAEQPARGDRLDSGRGDQHARPDRVAAWRGEQPAREDRLHSRPPELAAGQIASERGAIASLTASARSQSEAEGDRISRRVRQHREAIRELEEEIRRYDVDSRVRAVERERAELDVGRQVEAIERQIAQFDLESRVADVNRRIAALRVDESVAAVERQITALDSPRRMRALEARVAEALERLRAELRSR
jgi:hypothetical protein